MANSLNDLVQARESGDANEYAQLQIANYGLESSRRFWNEGRVKMLEKGIEEGSGLARPGFYADVAALLRLETQSDEGAA